MATHFHQLEVKDIRKETASCISVSFIIPPHLQTIFSFTQGQNLTIKTSIAGTVLRRSYSICSSPLDHELRIAIKKVPGGQFSAWAHTHLRPGVLLDVLPPSGGFFTPLQVHHKKNYLAFAAGSGITPVLSIIKTTLVTEPDSRFILVYGNKNRASIIFKDALDDLKNRYMDRFSVHHVLSREKTGSSLNSGRIDEEKCERIFAGLVDIHSCDEIFLCGPAAMIFSLQDFLLKKGVDKKRIHFELFTTPGSNPTTATTPLTSLAAPAETEMARVTVQSDGLSFEFDLSYEGDTILNAALQLGADLPFACKGGVCASCRAKLVNGQVSMDNNYALEPEELENGYILTCQSHPRSKNLKINFDLK
ncbi:MAG: 1,2-phenylacetyl-CoA epoxidase subunit PaaE [Bacteroidota bacterium]